MRILSVPLLARLPAIRGEMCANPQNDGAARFSGHPGRVLNKVIHRRSGPLQLFSGIQNLASKAKFYFNFDAGRRALFGSPVFCHSGTVAT
jgi:hypothetical protein